MDMKIPPLRIKIALESNPSESHNVSREIGRKVYIHVYMYIYIYTYIYIYIYTHTTTI